MNPPVVLAVAGTDSGGAAGLAADLTTIAALGAHGACVVAAVTAQDTTGVRAVHAVPADVIAAQLDAVLEDLPVAAVKTGMLGSVDAVRSVVDRCAHLPLVVDPVLVATSGAVLADEAVRAAYVEHLLPVASVVTPNAAEARTLLGLPDADATPAPELAARLAELGCAVVVTGGPDGDDRECTDWLAVPGRSPVALRHPAVETRNDHGTGCTHSAALATHLSHGLAVPDAARAALEFTTDRLRAGRDWSLGRGRGPVAHLFPTSPPVPVVSAGSTNERNHS